MSIKAVLVDGMVVLDDSITGERTVIAGSSPGPQVDLSTLGNGVLQQTVTLGVATLSVTAISNPLAKYIVQQPDASVPNAQALSLLSTGLTKNTTTTGVLSIAIDGVDYLSPTTGVTSVTATTPIVATGTNAVVVSLAANGVTAPFFRQSAPFSLVGNPTGSTANVTDVSLGAGLGWVGTTIVNTSPASGLSATPPIVLSGSVISLSIDGTLAVTSGNLGRAAITGDITIAAGSTTAAFRSFAATSVLGRAAGTSGVPTEISASANGQVLVRAGGVLTWGSVQSTSVAGTPGGVAYFDGTGELTDDPTNFAWDPVAFTVSISSLSAGGIVKAVSTTGALVLATVQASGTSGGGDVQGPGAYITALTGDVVATGPGSVTATIQPNVVTYAKIQQAGAHVLIGNPTGSTANVSEITLGTGLGFSGTTLVNTSPLSSLTATLPLQITGSDIEIRGAVTTGSTSTSPTSLGALASGVLQQSVAASVSTPSVFTATGGRVPFGSGTAGGLTDDANLTYSVASSVGHLTVGTTLTSSSVVSVAGNGGTASSTVTNGNSSISLTTQNNASATISIGSTGGPANLFMSGNSATNPSLISATATSPLSGSQLRLASDIHTFTLLMSGSTAPGPDQTSLVSDAANGIVILATGIGFATGTLPTTAQAGFLQLQSMPGAPSNPVSFILPGHIPVVFDSTDDRLYVYRSTWKIVGQNDAAIGPGVLITNTSGVHSAFNATVSRIPFGSGVNGGLTDNAGLTTDGATSLTLSANSGTNITSLFVTGSNSATGSRVRLANDLGHFLTTTLFGSTAASPDVATFSATTANGIQINGAAVYFASAALTTGATSAFLQLQSMAGVPTGVPAPIISGQVPIAIDSSDDRLYAYNSSWKPYAQYTGGLSTGLLKSTTGTGLWTIGVSGTDFAPPGNYITALTGDVTATGPGSVAATIASHAVTYAKMQQASTVVLLGNPTGGTANVQEITLGAGLAFSGTTLIATGSGGTVTNVTGTPPIVVATGTTTPAISLNIDSTLTVVASNLGRAAITGDVTIAAGANTATLVNIPNDTTMAADILATQSAAPATPAAGKGRLWYDSTAKTFFGINEGGVKSHLVTSRTAVASQFVTGLGDGGSLTAAQPSYSDLTGSVPAITQLTGDVTAGPGSGSQAATLATVNSNIGNFTYGSFTVNAKGLITAASSGTAPVTMTAGPGINLTSGGSRINLGSVGAPSAPTIAEFAGTPPSAAAAASMQAAYLWDLVSITLTGSTHVTGNGLALASFAGPSITDASAVTVDSASTLLVTGPPTAAGSVTLTASYALHVASGGVRVDQLAGPAVITSDAVGLLGTTAINKFEPVTFTLSSGVFIVTTATSPGQSGGGWLGQGYISPNTGPALEWAHQSFANGTAVAISINMLTNTFNDTVVYTVTKNGTATSATVSFTAGATGVANLSVTQSWTNTDRFGIRMTSSNPLIATSGPIELTGTIYLGIG